MSKATSYKYLSNKMISIHFPANCCHGNRSKPDTDEILPDIYCDAKNLPVAIKVDIWHKFIITQNNRQLSNLSTW